MKNMFFYMHINLNMLFFAILLGKLLMGREGTTYKLNLNPEATGEPHIIHSHAQLNSTRSFLVIHRQKLKILCADTRWWTEKTSVWSERRGHPANRPQIVLKKGSLENPQHGQLRRCRHSSVWLPMKSTGSSGNWEMHQMMWSWAEPHRCVEIWHYI